jgi:hypothetical protein
MPCMCGDTRCWSCGPAQGNHKCEICGRWDDEGGCENREECDSKAEAMYAKMAEDEARWQKELEEMDPPPAHELCPHDKEYHECNACMIASDLAYDAAREARMF